MGIIKTAILTGGGIYAVKKISKSAERRSENHNQNPAPYRPFLEQQSRRLQGQSQESKSQQEEYYEYPPQRQRTSYQTGTEPDHYRQGYPEATLPPYENIQSSQYPYSYDTAQGYPSQQNRGGPSTYASAPPMQGSHQPGFIFDEGGQNQGSTQRQRNQSGLPINDLLQMGLGLVSSGSHGKVRARDRDSESTENGRNSISKFFE